MEIDADDGVLLHRQPGAEVARAVDLPVHDASVARDQADEPGVLALVDVALQHRVQAFEPLGRESLGFRRASGQRLRGGRRGRQDEGDDKWKQRPDRHGARFYQATHPAVTRSTRSNQLNRSAPPINLINL